MIQIGVKICEDTQEMPQWRSTALPKHQKKERWGTNKDRTNTIYETTDTNDELQQKNHIWRAGRKTTVS